MSGDMMAKHHNQKTVAENTTPVNENHSCIASGVLYKLEAIDIDSNTTVKS